MMQWPTTIKLLSGSGSSELELVRFEREVQLTAKLTHPNTITIFDYGRTPDGIFYYVMELLDGASLQAVIELDGPQPAERVVSILLQIAGALEEAHAIDLIHRDIKPANIILCTQGEQAPHFPSRFVRECDHLLRLLDSVRVDAAQRRARHFGRRVEWRQRTRVERGSQQGEREVHSRSALGRGGRAQSATSSR